MEFNRITEMSNYIAAYATSMQALTDKRHQVCVKPYKYIISIRFLFVEDITRVKCDTNISTE
jgi:hypothetical protein